MTTTDAGATEISVRPAHQEDETEILGLMTDALGGGPTGQNTPEFFRWKHRDNPFGVSAGLLAHAEDRLVGVRLFLRWRLQSGPTTLRAVRAVDTATAPDHQGRGIFKRLTLGLLAELDRVDDVDLVFNTPNANSRPGYLSMGWQPVGILPVRLSPVHPVAMARGARAARATTASAARRGALPPAPASPARLPRCPFEPAGQVLADLGPEVCRLLEEARTPTGLHTPRSFEYLLWRYGQAPGLDYRCVVVESGGRPTGLAFGRMRARGPLTEFTVADLVVADGDTRSCRRLLAAARHSGADHVTVRTPPGSVEAGLGAAPGFLPVPGQGVGLVVNPRRRLDVDVLTPRTWQLPLGDLEVF
ncbi:GNAT family N-acetyltransferase [Nocardioides mesophilus]|uniref:GNAT family N-acetyltransferase n=1 Tax=Nocardioides mesophilus TaxID=433659 RepID=A0A7G9R991_9ACTN|nr:GNAT family N-acetyltransferase [Nocardioides mesophilus]QNN52166.1 GNAT family N-acetyltransferase [Nocardioides mesophilus]